MRGLSVGDHDDQGLDAPAVKILDEPTGSENLVVGMRGDDNDRAGRPETSRGADKERSHADHASAGVPVCSSSTTNCMELPNENVAELDCVAVAMVLGEIDEQVGGSTGLFAVIAKRSRTSGFGRERKNLEAEVVDDLSEDQGSALSVPFEVGWVQIDLGRFGLEKRIHRRDASMGSCDRRQ